MASTASTINQKTAWRVKSTNPSIVATTGPLTTTTTTTTTTKTTSITTHITLLSNHHYNNKKNIHKQVYKSKSIIVGSCNNCSNSEKGSRCFDCEGFFCSKHTEQCESCNRIYCQTCLDITKICFHCTEVLNDEFYEDNDEDGGGDYINNEEDEEEYEYDEGDMVDDTGDL